MRLNQFLRTDPKIFGTVRTNHAVIVLGLGLVACMVIDLEYDRIIVLITNWCGDVFDGQLDLIQEV